MHPFIGLGSFMAPLGCLTASSAFLGDVFFYNTQIVFIDELANESYLITTVEQGESTHLREVKAAAVRISSHGSPRKK